MCKITIRGELKDADEGDKQSLEESFCRLLGRHLEIDASNVTVHWLGHGSISFLFLLPIRHAKRLEQMWERQPSDIQSAFGSHENRRPVISVSRVFRYDDLKQCPIFSGFSSKSGESKSCTSETISSSIELVPQGHTGIHTCTYTHSTSGTCVWCLLHVCTHLDMHRYTVFSHRQSAALQLSWVILRSNWANYSTSDNSSSVQSELIFHVCVLWSWWHGCHILNPPSDICTSCTTDALHRFQTCSVIVPVAVTAVVCLCHWRKHSMGWAKSHTHSMEPFTPWEQGSSQ